ncbi:MAG: tetratricopeptide repeat protein, partial [bacterium]|nr:tetratricopeptide repeat protein [bacterium]
RAEQLFLTLLENHPDDAEAAYMLGRIYFQENRGDYAMAQFQRVLKLDPRSYRAHNNIALCYEAGGDTQMAIRHFLTAIKLVEKDHPEYDWPYSNLADLLLKQDDAERAYQAVTIAAKRNPYSARNFFLGGKALSKLGRNEDARKWLLRSADLDPSYPEPLYLLGQVYMKLGEREKAKETLTRFREVKANAPRKRK